MKSKLFLLFTLFYLSSLSGQEKETKFKIGYNLAPLLFITTDLFVEASISPSVAIIVNLGNTFGPVRGVYLKDDGVELDEMYGYYFKVGGKYVWLKTAKGEIWSGLNLIGSYYSEEGTRFGTEVSAEGFLLGAGFISGVDLRMFDFMDFRSGFQIGYYERSDHLSSNDMTYQPGFGVIYQFPVPTQLILGFVFKL